MSSPAYALTDALCGQPISGTVVLTEDLDCTGHPGAPSTGAPPGTVPGAAITISANDTTLDGSGCMATLGRNCRILAPDSAYAVYAKGWKNVTVQNVAVDGWCNGVGIYIEGGAHTGADPGHRIVDVEANGRSYGVHVFNTSRVQIRDLSTDSASTAGLYLQGVTQSATNPLILRDLHLDNSLVGLLVNGFNGQDATCAGNVRACNYTFHAGAPAGLDDDANAAVLGSIKLSDTGIHFSGYVTNATVLGPTSGPQVVFDGTTAGINAYATGNSNLTFQNLDVSSAYGTGMGLYVFGANIEVVDVVADGRSDGVRASSTSNLSVRKLQARSATARGLFIESPSAPLFLEELTLEDCATGLSISSFAPPTTPERFAITQWVVGSGGTIASLADSDTGIQLSNVRDITLGVAPTNPAAPNYSLRLGNATYGIDASAGTNARLTFTNIDLSHARQASGIGLALGGSEHRLEYLRVERRSQGLNLNGVSGTQTTLKRVWSRANNFGLYLQNMGSASTMPSFEAVDLRRNAIAIGIGNWSKALTPFDETIIETPGFPSATPRIDLAESRVAFELHTTANLIFRNLVLDQAVAGIRTHDNTGANDDLTIDNCDVSGQGLGTGIALRRGSRVSITNVIANRRETGVSVTGMNALSITGLEARYNAVGLGLGYLYRTSPYFLYTSVTQAPRVVAPDLRDNGTGLGLTAWDLKSQLSDPYYPVTGLAADPLQPTQVGIFGLDVAGSDYGIYSGGSLKGMSFEHMSLDNPTIGIYMNGAGSDLRFDDLDLSGPGRGTGLSCRDDGYGSRCGTDILFRDITVSHRSKGMFVNGNDLRLEDIVAHHNAIGLQLVEIRPTTETAIPPELVNLALDYNGTGLALHGITGSVGSPWSLGSYELATDTGAIASLAGNDTGLSLTSCSHLLIAGPPSPGPLRRIEGRDYGIYAQTSNVGLTLRRLDLSGFTGIGLHLRGSGHVLEDLRVDGREVGLELSSTIDPVLRRIEARGSRDAGIHMINTVINGSTVLDALELEDNGLGLNVQSTSGTGTLALDSAALSALGGNRTSLSVTYAANVSVDSAGLGLTSTAIPGGFTYAQPLPASNALCGTVITAVTHPGLLVELNADLDCRGTIGTALTIGADGIVIDGKGHKILAPHAAVVIAAVNRDNITIRNIDVSGAYLRGTGIDIFGGDEVTLSDVLADRRQFGAWLRGTVPNPLGHVTVTGFTSRFTGGVSGDLNSSAGLYISGASTRPDLIGLTLQYGEHHGLWLDSIDGAVAGEPWIIDGAALLSVTGNATSIYLTNGIQNTTLLGPIAGLDGRLYGIRAESDANAALSLVGLVVDPFTIGGAGVSVRGGDTVVDNLTARRRGTGIIVARGSDIVIDGVYSQHNTIGLQLAEFSDGDTLATLNDIDISDNKIGLDFSGWTQTKTFDVAELAPFDWTGCDTAIQVSSSSNLTFADQTFTNVANALATNAGGTASTNITLLNLTSSGPGRGTGFTLNGGGHRLTNVRADGHATGVSLRAASGAQVNVLQANNNNLVGLSLSDMTSSETAPVLSDVTLHDNLVGLGVYWVATPASTPWVLDNAPAGSLQLDVSGSWTGIQSTASGQYTAGTHRLVLQNFRDTRKLDNPTTGISISERANTSLVNVDASGDGFGTGILLRGSGHAVSNVDAHQRTIGLDAKSPDVMAIASFKSNFSTYGLYLTLLYAGTAPTLSNLDLRWNSIAIGLNQWSAPMTFTPAVGLLLAGSATGFELSGNASVADYNVQNITLQNFVGADALRNPTVGIWANLATHRNLVLSNIDASGSGRGTGVWLGGANLQVSNLTANKRATGLALTATGTLQVTGLSVSDATSAALSITSPVTWPTLAGLSLTNSAIGLSVSGARGTAGAPLLIDDSMFVATLVDGVSRPTFDGHLTSIRLTNRIEHLQVKNLPLSGTLYGLNAGSIAGEFSNRSILLENVDATGQCRGVGVELRGQDHSIVGTGGQSSTLSMRATGLQVQDGDRVEVRDSVVASNVKGIRVLGNSSTVNTTVIARITGSNTATEIRVANVGYIYAGQTLRVGVGTGQVQDQVVKSVSSDLVTFQTGLTDPTNGGVAWIPPAGTIIQSLDYQASGWTRLTVQDSDICANGRGGTNYALSADARPVIATDDYWRASTGSTSVTTNPGDFVTIESTNTTRVPFETVPTDKANDYCNQAPVPAIAASPELCAGDTVVLDGTPSYDPDCGSSALDMPDCAVPVASSDTSKELFTYQWLQSAGTAVSLVDSQTASAYFVAPQPPPGQSNETYTFALRVADDVIPRTTTTQLTVRRRHLPPVAAAGPGQTVAEGTTAVALAGSGADPDAQPLTYQWVQTAGPSVTLSDANAQSPTFDAPLVAANTTLTFALTVTDTEPPGECGGPLSSMASVSVQVNNLNLPPVADAGTPETVNAEDPVTLDGTLSDDPDNDPLVYAWVQTGGVPVVLLGAGTPTPTFIAPYVIAAEVLTFALTVTDPGGLWDTRPVTITIFPACAPGDSDCDPCAGLPDGTVLAASIPCGAGACGAVTGSLTCQGGVPVNSCEPALSTIPDTTCAAAPAVAYAIVYDAGGRPQGSIRCTHDVLGAVVCDEEDDQPGHIKVYDALWCPGVTP